MGRRGGDMEMEHGSTEMRYGMKRQWDGWSHIHVWRIEIQKDTLGLRDPSPRPDHIAQGSSAGKINPHNFWL